MSDMNIRSHLNQTNSIGELKNLVGGLDRQIGKWGGREVTLKGFEGNVALKDVVKKFLEISKTLDPKNTAEIADFKELKEKIITISKDLNKKHEKATDSKVIPFFARHFGKNDKLDVFKFEMAALSPTDKESIKTAYTGSISNELKMLSKNKVGEATVKKHMPKTYRLLKQLASSTKTEDELGELRLKLADTYQLERRKVQGKLFSGHLDKAIDNELSFISIIQKIKSTLS